MALVFNLNDIVIENVFFLEARNNIIMDGKFTKIVYSDENVVANGIYVTIPLNDYTRDNSHGRIILKHTKNNDAIIKRVCEFEYYILKYFKHLNENNKHTKFLLREQLDTMFVKVYRGNSNYSHDIVTDSKLSLKISGVWEDSDSIGLTYKIMEMFPLT